MNTPARILVVEDEVIVAMDLQDRLADLGYDVAGTCTTGEQTLECVPGLKPDLVLMGIMLDGDLDGIETAARLRAACDVPVVFLTAYSDDATLKRTIATTSFGYIVEPFEEHELYATIEVALHTHTMQRRLQQQRDDLLQILDGLRQGMAMTDAGDRLTFLSRTAHDLLGTDDEALGKLWWKIFPLAEPVMDALLTAAEHPPGDRCKVPAEVTGADGARYHVEIEVLDDPRKPARHIFVFYDVTEEHVLRR